MLLSRVLNYDAATTRHVSERPNASGSAMSSKTSTILLSDVSCKPALSRTPSRLSSPNPSGPEATASTSSAAIPRPPSPRPSPSRVPSRTQLRRASVAGRLSIEGLCKDISSDQYQLSVSAISDPDTDAAAPPPEPKPHAKSTASQASSKQRQVKEEVLPPVVAVKPAPYLRDTMDAVGVGLMSDSANMETLMGNRHFLKASFMTPESVLAKIQHNDNFYHVWVAAMLAMEEMSIKQNGFEKVLRLAFTKFLVELGSAIVDCLNPDLPHYTFVDPREIMQPDGRKAMLEQAVAIVEGLENKGIKRDKIYISIPATESGLVIAKNLKEQYSIKTNLVFVSGLAQAAACAAAGAAAVTMPVNSILTYHETKSCLNCSELSPHPGRQNIKATACYMTHHELETQVIATRLRSLSEIEHCSALSSVCLADFQVETAKWYRTRVCRPPGPNSTAMMRATQVPFPPVCPQDEHGFRYLTIMSGETRRETIAVLDAGLAAWQDAVACIADVIRGEMQRRMGICAAPPPKTLVYRELVGAERCRSWMSRGQPRQDTLDIPFPSSDDEQSKLTVPPSPYWKDLSSFDDIDSSSSEED